MVYYFQSKTIKKKEKKTSRLFRNRKFYFCGVSAECYYLSGLSLVDSSSCVHIHTYNIFHRFSVINSPQIRHKLPTKSKIFEIVVKKFVKLKVAKCTCLVSLSLSYQHKNLIFKCWAYKWYIFYATYFNCSKFFRVENKVAT